MSPPGMRKRWMRQKFSTATEKALFSQQVNYYADTVQNPFQGNPVPGDISTKILIIGGGFAGLGTAMSLAERGEHNCVLIDAERIGFGASGRNGGFVFGGFSLGEPSLIRQLGTQRGRWAYELTTQAVTLIRQRIERYNISCDAIEHGVILANWFNESAQLRAKQKFLQDQLGVEWSWVTRADMQAAIKTERYFNGLFEQNAFHFHPLKYAHGLAKTLAEKGVAVYEQSPALTIDPQPGQGFTVSTPSGVIQAEQVIIACGGYLNQLYQPVTRAILPISTYVMVTEPLDPVIDEWLPTAAAIYDTRFAFDYYRKLPDKRLLWGGRISISQRHPTQVQKLLQRDVKKVFPPPSPLATANIEYAWGGLMGYATHQMPMIGQTQPGLWHVTGFGGHGVGPTTAGGELIARAISEGDSHYKWLDRYAPNHALGQAGLLGSQLTYWSYQAIDWIKEKRYN